MKKSLILLLTLAVPSAQAAVSPRLREAIKVTNLAVVQEELPKAKLAPRELVGLVELATQRINDLKVSLDQLNAPKISYDQWGSQGSNTIRQNVEHQRRDDIQFIAPYSAWYTLGLGTGSVVVGAISAVSLEHFLGHFHRNNLGAGIAGAGCISAFAMMIAASVFSSRNDAAYKAKVKLKYDEALDIKQLLYEYEAR